ncbi:hypothetical protein EDC48_11594 [Gibbsiella quercinecans]|nr:hypothetical protein EDC48_11594 [Gibbsiella quercinecans]
MVKGSLLRDIFVLSHNIHYSAGAYDQIQHF